MKDKQDLIDRTMSSLDNIHPVAAPLGFESRLMEKLEAQSQWQQYIRLAAAALVIFALVNVFTVFQLTVSSSQDTYLDEAYFVDSTILNFTDDE